MRAGSQPSIILKQLRDKRTVSKLIALHAGIGNIHEVIRRLRSYGHVIATSSDFDARGREFTKYVLVHDADSFDDHYRRTNRPRFAA